ncbi:hypothetical protein HID58_060766 [Brassica napus]|uniref:Protein kinase domain-containing protein n=2 Tax=Brassica TaxID=3705 RepID=A0ABQ7ZWM5_BRANA|nr:hypothetical protein HID58_060766 [Brassica napus]
MNRLQSEASSAMKCWRIKEKEESEKEAGRKCFLKNGSMFLDQLIADCNSMPVGGEEEHAYKDIVLSARVSNNNGFLKLIGCCLEFPHPLMVFEDVEYKALNIRGSLGSEDVPVSPWNAKLTDFSLAVTLPAGKSWIKDRVSGTPGYLDSTYSSTGSIVTEYADVYSFGILMLVLLMGRRPDMDGPEFTYYILDYARDLQERGELIEFGGGSKDMRPGQKKMFLDLALRCCAMRNEDMPKMILVAKEILVTSITLRIHQNIPPSSINVAEKFAEIASLTHKGDGILEKEEGEGQGEKVNRMFSSYQISKAINNFDPKYSLPDIPSPLRWYKEVIEGRSYVIKRLTRQVGEESAYNDIVLSARVSNHIGFLKLMGCCLEFLHPVLVFEDLEYRSLNTRGSVGSLETPVLPWNNGRAKLTGFSLAVTLPEGKTWIQDRLAGTFGYIDPIYHLTKIVSEYTDVYSFGIFMLVLLMGRPQLLSDGHSVFGTSILKHVKDLLERGEPVEFGGGSNDMRPGQMRMCLDLALGCCEERNEDRPKMILELLAGFMKDLYEKDKLDEVTDTFYTKMVKDMTSGQRFQMEACVALALRCCGKVDESRPKMIEVAKELKRIQTSL